MMSFGTVALWISYWLLKNWKQQLSRWCMIKLSFSAVAVLILKLCSVLRKT